MNTLHGRPQWYVHYSSWWIWNKNARTQHSRNYWWNNTALMSGGLPYYSIWGMNRCSIACYAIIVLDKLVNAILLCQIKSKLILVLSNGFQTIAILDGKYNVFMSYNVIITTLKTWPWPGKDVYWKLNYKHS